LSSLEANDSVQTYQERVWTGRADAWCHDRDVNAIPLRDDQPALVVTRRYALRDDPWERIQDLLPGSKGWVGVTAKNNRLFVDAVRYCYRAGIPWWDWPDRVGHDRKIHPRFRRWAKTSLWERVFATCDALGNPTGFHLTPGQACDLDGADVGLADIPTDTGLADKGYDADERVIEQ